MRLPIFFPLLFLATVCSLFGDTHASASNRSLRTRAAVNKPGANRQLFVPVEVNNVFPYVVASSSRTTTFYLTNLEDREIKVFCEFVGPNGEESPFAFDFSANAEDVTLYTESNISPFSTASFHTVSTATEATTGWAFCQSDSGTDRFSGYAVVQFTASNGSSREFITPLQPYEEPIFSVPFTAGASSQTALLLINITTEDDSTLALWYYDSEGKTVGNGSITLKPGTVRSILLNDVFKDVSNGTVRVVRVEGTTGITGMALRLNAAGFTAFPVLTPQEAPPAPPQE